MVSKESIKMNKDLPILMLLIVIPFLLFYLFQGKLFFIIIMIIFFLIIYIFCNLFKQDNFKHYLMFLFGLMILSSGFMVLDSTYQIDTERTSSFKIYPYKVFFDSSSRDIILNEFKVEHHFQDKRGILGFTLEKNDEMEIQKIMLNLPWNSKVTHIRMQDIETKESLNELENYTVIDTLDTNTLFVINLLNNLGNKTSFDISYNLDIVPFGQFTIITENPTKGFNNENEFIEFYLSDYVCKENCFQDLKGGLKKVDYGNFLRIGLTEGGLHQNLNKSFNLLTYNPNMNLIKDNRFAWAIGLVITGFTLILHSLLHFIVMMKYFKKRKSLSSYIIEELNKINQKITNINQNKTKKQSKRLK